MLSALRGGLRGALFALIALIVLSIAATAIAYGTPDPDALTTPLSLCVLALAPLTGGWIAYRAGRRGGCTSRLLCGLLCAAITLSLLFCLSLCLPDDLRGQWPSSLAWGLRGGILAFCLLGTVMAAYAPRKKKKRRR
jgi:cbb3-type cytochrome oxidase subunit 3